MIIDIHAHCLPQETLDRLARGARRFPSVALVEDGGGTRLAFAGGAPTRPVAPGLRRHPPRREFMAANGIDVQLVGGWLDAFGYELPPEEGADWSRFLNEEALAACRPLAGVVPLATVPLQDGRLAAAVLAEAVAAGMPGAMIGTQPHGDHGNLDAAHLDPFWEQAAALGVPVVVHPMFGSSDARLADFELMNAVGRVNDVTVALARLLFSGHLLRHESLRVVAATGGGALPYALGRLARNHAAHPGRFADPVAGFARLYFDSIVFDTDTLRYLVGKAGAARIMLGSDYPFPIGDPRPRQVVETAGLAPAERDLVLGETARRLFAIAA